MNSTIVVGMLEVVLRLRDAEFQSKLAEMESKFRQTGQRMQQAGSALSMAITAPLALIGIGAAKASIQFESSFAGVRKTVNATEPEFKKLAQTFRDMAKEIPINVNELNRIGEAAGQLGIQKEHIAEFTRTMADLGVTTNLTSDQAANAVARIQNIFGAAGEDTQNLASTLVALGNAGASTESEIVELSLRIAGAGHTVNLTQAEVLSFASAIASVGIDAESGGTAISRVFINMANAAAQGGDKIDEFARVAGVSGETFRKAFQEDAAGAMITFIDGLGRVKEQGGNLFQILEDVGLSEIRVRDAMLRLAGAGQLVREQLAIGTEAWRENTALTVEAEKRYQTAGSQLTLFWNRVHDVAIALGDQLVPALLRGLDALEPWLAKLATLVEWFSKLPSSVQLSVFAFAGLAAALGPVLFVFGSMLTSISALIGVAGLPALTLALRAAATAHGLFAGAQVVAGLANTATAVTTAGKALKFAADEQQSFNFMVKEGTQFLLPLSGNVAAASVVTAGLTKATWAARAAMVGWLGAVSTTVVGIVLAYRKLGDYVDEQQKKHGKGWGMMPTADESARRQGDLPPIIKSPFPRMMLPGLAVPGNFDVDEMFRAASAGMGRIGQAAQGASGGVAQLSDEIKKLVAEISGAEDRLNNANFRAAVASLGGITRVTGMLPNAGGSLDSMMAGLMKAPGAMNAGSLDADWLRITTQALSPRLSPFAPAVLGPLSTAVPGPPGTPGSGSVTAFLDTMFTGMPMDRSVQAPSLMQRMFGGQRGMSSTIMQTLIGGGDVGRSLGGSLGWQAVSGLMTTGAGKGLGSLLGGTLGSILPGVGTILGSLVGKLFGKMFGKSEQEQFNPKRQAFIDEHGGLGGLNAAVVEATGSDALTKQLLAAKSLKQYEDAIKAVTKALDEHKQKAAETWQAVLTSMDAVNARTMAGITTQESFNIAAMGAVATFSAYVTKTGDVVGGLEKLGPTLDSLKQRQEELGFAGSAALEKLMGMREVAVANADVLKAAQANVAVMDALGAAGLLNQDIFSSWGLDSVNQFNTMINRGVAMDQALGLMQPTLQKLWQAQQKYGFKVDDVTQALINQGLEAGIIGEDNQTINDQLLKVLKDIRDVLKDSTKSAKDYAGALDLAARDREFTVTEHRRQEDEGSTPEGFAGGTHGRYVDFRGGTDVRLHGLERVMTPGEALGSGLDAGAIVDQLQRMEQAQDLRDTQLFTKLRRALRYANG